LIHRREKGYLPIAILPQGDDPETIINHHGPSFCSVTGVAYSSCFRMELLTSNTTISYKILVVDDELRKSAGIEGYEDLDHLLIVV
jgi:hypothetical protein